MPQTRSWQSRMCLKRRKKKLGRLLACSVGFLSPFLLVSQWGCVTGALHLQRCSIAPGLSETFGLMAVCGCAEDSSQILIVLQTQLCEEGRVGPAGGEQGCACFCLPCEWERRPYTCRSGSLMISPACQSAMQWGGGCSLRPFPPLCLCFLPSWLFAAWFNWACWAASTSLLGKQQATTHIAALQPARLGQRRVGVAGGDALRV